MLLMLGFNDMGWFYSDAPGTIDSIGTLIANARSVNSNMKFAVASKLVGPLCGLRELSVARLTARERRTPTQLHWRS